MIMLLFFLLIFAQTVNAISLMTFNMPIKPYGESEKFTREHSWAKRKKDIIRFIKNHQPTILGCQELGHFQNHYLEDKLKGRGYKRYGEVNKQFSLFGIDKLSWIPLIFDRDVQFNPLFYKKQEIEILDKDTLWLSDEKWEPQDGTSVVRICSWIKCREKKSDKIFYIFNTHLDHKNDTDARRVEGIERILNVANAIQEEVPIFIMGDFNIGLYGDFGKRLSQAGFIDSRSIAQATSPASLTYIGWHNDRHSTIDFIMVKNGHRITVSEHAVLTPEKKLSDHNPVMIDFSWAS